MFDSRAGLCVTDRAILGSFELFWALLGFFEFFWALLGSFGLSLCLAPLLSFSVPPPSYFFLCHVAQDGHRGRRHAVALGNSERERKNERRRRRRRKKVYSS